MPLPDCWGPGYQHPSPQAQVSPVPTPSSAESAPSEPGYGAPYEQYAYDGGEQYNGGGKEYNGGGEYSGGGEEYNGGGEYHGGEQYNGGGEQYWHGGGTARFKIGNPARVRMDTVRM